jgi:hypothetical protein
LLYLAEGDEVNAALAFAAMVPLAGIGATVARRIPKPIRDAAAELGEKFLKKPAQKAKEFIQDQAGKAKDKIDNALGMGKKGDSTKVKFDPGESKLWTVSKIDAAKKEHIFSKKHLNGGVMDLGKSRNEIVNTAGEKLNDLNLSGKLRDGHNIIKTTMNGHEATIRAYFKDGQLMSLDIHKGIGNRKWGEGVNVINEL